MNTVHLSGNIGAEPEFKIFDSGKRKVSFSVALNQYRANGEHCDTIWIPCQAWDSVYDRIFKCQQKAKLSGRKINITGNFTQSKWTDQTTGKQHSKLMVKIQTFELLPATEHESPRVASESAAEIVFEGRSMPPL